SANFAENPDYEFFRARPFNRIDHRDRAGNVRKPLSYPSPGYSGYSRSERPARTRTHGLGKDRSLYPADSPAVAWKRSSPGTLRPGVGDRADPRACCTGRGGDRKLQSIFTPSYQINGCLWGRFDQSPDDEASWRGDPDCNTGQID